jgi:hypothetical protein
MKSPPGEVKCFKIPADVRQTARCILPWLWEKPRYRPAIRAVFYA